MRTSEEGQEEDPEPQRHHLASRFPAAALPCSASRTLSASTSADPSAALCLPQQVSANFRPN